MKQLDQRGNVNSLLIPLVLSVILFIGSVAFAIWAFTGMQDYKNNVDEKVSVANAEVKKKTQLEDAAKYAEEAKNPLQPFVGPATFGNVEFDYPKTWSVYQSTSSESPTLDVYFNPQLVPATTDKAAAYALRFKIVNQKYDTVLRQYSAKKGITITPTALAKVEGVIGTRIEGQIETDTQGVMVIVPIRDKTLQIWTESAAYLADFNEKVLPTLTFVP